MNAHTSGKGKTCRKLSRVLALLSITALALAASPAALADDCGGPGAPSVQSYAFLSKLPLSPVSWSD